MVPPDPLSARDPAPTALYALEKLVAIGPPVCVRLYELPGDASSRRAIDLVAKRYERAKRCGPGMPNSSALDTDEMLSDALRREVPPVTRPLIDWLRDQDDTRLTRWGVTAEHAASREYYPRTHLGAYFEDELDALCKVAVARGHEVIIHPLHEVLDIVPDEAGVRILGCVGELEFDHKADHVLLATGHDWPPAPEIGGVALRTP